ncbi:MAG TPA: sugar phosphate isomerase/epimerase [Abditibacteriaceae bacterium]|jgi:sugar phosphate isomerase/epimerase
MTQIPVAAQLYSVREECERDLMGTLEKVAKMGFDGVEFAGFHGHSAQDVRAKLDEVGLRVAGAHIQFSEFSDEAIDATIEYHRTIGNRFLIVPWVDTKTLQSKAAWLELAERINGIAEKVKPHGMRMGYHNHDFEFKNLPDTDELPWDIFFGATNQDVVMQFDTANALGAGAKASDFLRKYPNRATTVHLKEHSADGSAMLGEGDVPFREIMEICESTGGTQWYIIEHEKYPVPPMECIERDLRNFEKLR